MDRTESYLICSTPRTGSTFLCGLLQSTGIAGHPESYFRQPDEHLWAERWSIARSADGGFDYADYVRAARVAGSTNNGVSAVRIMWGTLDYMVDKLGAVYPDLAGADLGLLKRVFGETRFLYLKRDDVLAQAASRLRAEQTNVWHRTDQFQSEHPKQKPYYDFDQIGRFVHEINEHNAAWQEWFATVGVQPHLVRYENLDADPVGTTNEVLDFLMLEPPAKAEILAPNNRRADELNAQWIDRYRAELVEGGGQNVPQL